MNPQANKQFMRRRTNIIQFKELSSVKHYKEHWDWVMINFEIFILIVTRGRKLIGISGSLIWSKTLMELTFNPCGEFLWSLEGPVSQIHSPHLHVRAPGIFSDFLKIIQMLKRKWGAESNGKVPHLFIPGKTVTLVHEFAVEDMPSAELPPRLLRLQWRTCPLSKHFENDPTAIIFN